MVNYRFWLISTEFTMLELRQWATDNPDDGVPLGVALGDELCDLAIRVLATANLLERYAELMGGQPLSLN